MVVKIIFILLCLLYTFPQISALHLALVEILVPELKLKMPDLNTRNLVCHDPIVMWYCLEYYITSHCWKHLLVRVIQHHTLGIQRMQQTA